MREPLLGFAVCAGFGPVHVDAVGAAVDLRGAELDEQTQTGIELDALFDANQRGVRGTGVASEIDAGMGVSPHALLTMQARRT